MSAFLSLISRDIQLAFREGGAVGIALAFYLVVIVTIPIGLGPDLQLLGKIAPGILWVGLLLSLLLSVDRMFQADHRDGTLELLALGPLPLELVVVAKAIAHAISTALPLILVAPVLGLMVNLDLKAYPVLFASMVIGAPGISFLGAVGAALTVGLGRGGVLLSLIILPLCLPILIFGVSAVSTALVGPGSPLPALLILSAVSLVFAVIGPIAAAYALRWQLG